MGVGSLYTVLHIFTGLSASVLTVVSALTPVL